MDFDYNDHDDENNNHVQTRKHFIPRPCFWSIKYTNRRERARTYTRHEEIFFKLSVIVNRFLLMSTIIPDFECN